MESRRRKCRTTGASPPEAHGEAEAQDESEAGTEDLGSEVSEVEVQKPDSAQAPLTSVRGLIYCGDEVEAEEPKVDTDLRGAVSPQSR